MWAKPYIEDFVKKGYIKGYEDGTFKPNGLITRGEFACILSLCFDLYDKDAKCNFTDINESDWAYGYVASLAKTGVLKGGENNECLWNEVITRQDMSVMVYRLLELKSLLNGKNSELDFTDSEEISDYAKDAVAYLKNAGVISGMENNSFEPLKNATRAQAVKVLSTVLGGEK